VEDAKLNQLVIDIEAQDILASHLAIGSADHDLGTSLFEDRTI
jgi:hypothetical protein